MKRWPIVRHVRYLVAAWQFDRWWWAIGRYLGAVPNPRDIQHLEDIWKGKA